MLKRIISQLKASFASQKKLSAPESLESLNRLNLAGALLSLAGTLILLNRYGRSHISCYQHFADYISDLGGREKRRNYAAGNGDPLFDVGG